MRISHHLQFKPVHLPIATGQGSHLGVPIKITNTVLAVILILLGYLLIHQLPINHSLTKISIDQNDTISKIQPTHLQYNSQGHVLGFGSSQVVIAGSNHALTMTLTGAHAIEPIAQHPDRALDNSSLDKDGGIQPFSNPVIYVHPWSKVSVIYKPQSDAIVESEYHIERGFNKQTLDQIRIQYNRPVEIDDQGKLCIKYDLGTMQESAPIAWQTINGQKVYVPVHYKKHGSLEIGFNVNSYDPNYGLVIDPSLTWNTFIGQKDSGHDSAHGVTVDVSGNIYIVGESEGSWSNPIRSYSGDNDAFVTKLDSNGNLLWHTFLGGSGVDNLSDITFDNSNHIIVSGKSSISWGTPLRSYSGGYDIFIAKLDNNGNFLWHSFLGGTSNDQSSSVDVDINNDILVAGTSNNSWGTPVRNYIDGQEGFVAKLNSSGTLLWNTFLGATGNDSCSDIHVASGDNMIVTGFSLNSWGTPIQGFSSLIDGYVAELDEDGNLLWNTFFGGSGADLAYAVVVDLLGKIVVTGYSTASWGAPIQTYTGGYDAFVTQFDSGGNRLWNTFLGGGLNDTCESISIDSSNNIIVGGYASSNWGTPVQNHNGGYDILVAKLNNSGTLLWHTFLGNSNTDWSNALNVDGNNIIICGRGDSSWGSPIRSYSNDNDALVAKLDSSGNLLWNTFLGGTGEDHGYALAVDSSSNIYITGSSTDSWATPIRDHSGTRDAYVVKMDSTGNLLWNTFLGSTGSDDINAIFVDSSYNIFISGTSNTTWGTPIRSYTMDQDAFLAKLDSNGNLLWNTFLGGPGLDQCFALDLDSSDNIYVSGHSSSDWGSPVRSYSSGWDSFIAKLDNNGNFLWHTFLGGSGIDQSFALDADGGSHIYITGNSTMTWGTPIQNHNGGIFDTTLAKLDTSGSLLWNTFIGGAGNDYSRAISTDSIGNLYIGGYSTATWGTPIRSYTNVIDAFIAKFDTNGILLWNTFLGGTGVDYLNELAVDNNYNVYIGGDSNTSWSTPLWPFSSLHDGYIAKLDISGNLIWNAFFGGTGDDKGYTLALDGNDIYIGGTSEATWGSPIAPYNSSPFDAFVIKINDPLPTPTITPTATITTTATHSPTLTPTPTISATYSPTPIVSPTSTMTITPTLSPSPTKTLTALTSLLSNLIIYPNPFRVPNQQVTIQYSLSEDADITITLYTYMGNIIKQVNIKAGMTGGQGSPNGQTNHFNWDGRNEYGLLQSTGGYICQIVARSALSDKQEKVASKIGLIR